MTIKVAVRNGRFSQRGTWSDRRIPRPGDTIRANGYEITMDKDARVRRVDSSPLIKGSRTGGAVVVRRGRTFNCGGVTGSGRGAAVTLNGYTAAIICFGNVTICGDIIC